MLIPSILSHTESHYLLYTLGVAGSWDLDVWIIELDIGHKDLEGTNSNQQKPVVYPRRRRNRD